MNFLQDLSIDKVRNLAEDAFNQAKPKTEVEARVYEVLSHKNWGASSSLLNEIARDTYDYEKFAVISQIMWESMENQRPAAWRLVFKGLTLLEHLVKNGSERCVDDARNHGHLLRSLQNFNYYEGTIDRGSGVREKSKQLMEILSDDERVREERQKARELREKFGQKIGGVSSSGNRSGYSSGGYGNDNWNTTGASGGYGDGGIGSGGSGGRYGNDRDSGRGGGSSPYSGRYDEDDTRPPRVMQSTPTFATMTDDSEKKKKKKKKKAPAPAEPEPEVDLFSFDAPAPAPAAATTAEPASEEFDAFQTAGRPSAAVANDPFAVPATVPEQSNDQFGAFESSPAPAQRQQNQQFNAFGGQQPAMGGGGGQPAMGGGMSAGNAAASDPFAGMGGSDRGVKSQPQMPMGGGGMMQQQQQPQQANDDEFGDFAGSAPAMAQPAMGQPTMSSSADPMSKLISLDGLSKNPSKPQSKLNAPIIANDAAATFVQERDQIQASVQQGVTRNSFSGIDGLQKTPNMMGGGQQINMNMMGGGGMGSNISMMGGASSGNAIGMMDPQMMAASQQTQQGGFSNQQGYGQHGGQPGQQPGGYGQQQQFQQQQMMGGGGMGMQGGMGFQQGGMNPQQQQQMNNQMMGGMGMQGNMGGGAQGNANYMGGQQWQ